MSTAAETLLFQFECPVCSGAMLSPADQVGEPYACPHCEDDGHRVPEPTEEGVAAAQGVDVPRSAEPQETFSAAPTAERSSAGVSYEQAYEQYRREFGVTASPLVRLLAKIIDVACMGAAFLGSMFFAVLAGGAVGATLGQQANPLAELVFLGLVGIPPTALAIFQWTWTANAGKTIGKHLLGIRIVRRSDEMPPGFFSGVFMRSWVNGLLGAIPFYGLVDVLFIFDQGRCLHDRLADTIVISGGSGRAGAA